MKLARYTLNTKTITTMTRKEFKALPSKEKQQVVLDWIVAGSFITIGVLTILDLIATLYK